jgi:MYXO-CTERM domain-containing protein
MQHVSFSAMVRTGVVACSLLLLPLTLPTSAQVRETTPAPETRAVDTHDDSDNSGLWGLLGLVGLAGLAGRRRHAEPARAYTDTRERRSA